MHGLGALGIEARVAGAAREGEQAGCGSNRKASNTSPAPRPGRARAWAICSKRLSGCVARSPRRRACTVCAPATAAWTRSRLTRFAARAARERAATARPSASARRTACERAHAQRRISPGLHVGGLSPSNRGRGCSSGPRTVQYHHAQVFIHDWASLRSRSSKQSLPATQSGPSASPALGRTKRRRGSAFPRN